MIILTTAWSIFDDNEGKYELIRNGGAIMINDICEFIGRRELSYLFVGNVRLSPMNYGNIHVMGNEWFLPEYRNTKNIEDWHDGLKKGFLKTLKELKPDIVLVQGGGEFSTNCMEICKGAGQRFAFVDHLFQGNNILDKTMKEWEDKTFSDNEMNVITVSSSMRQNILSVYPNLNPEKIVAIPNGTPFERRSVLKRDFRKELNLGEKRVLLCSGTLHPRKNQVQIIDAYDMLPECYKSNITILLCGNDSKKIPQRDIIEQKIMSKGLEERIMYIGTFSRDDMHDLYESVDGIIIASHNEGLSLVALESLVYGKPIIMFSENETAGDVSHPCATVLVEDKTDIALRDGIIEWYNRKWDHEEIKRYSESFCMENVADKYIKYCSKLVSGE